VMKQTDHYKAFRHNPEVLAVFSSAHSYVSASWYSDPKQASTWNYQAVHAKGRLRFLDDNKLLDVLKRLTTQFENNPTSPSLVEHLSTDYVGRLMKAIVAFEVDVYFLDHVFKLSQNRDEESYSNIVENLETGDVEAREVAAAMRENLQTGGAIGEF
jgi:transcriptional regulator